MTSISGYLPFYHALLLIILLILKACLENCLDSSETHRDFFLYTLPFRNTWAVCRNLMCILKYRVNSPCQHEITGLVRSPGVQSIAVTFNARLCLKSQQQIGQTFYFIEGVVGLVGFGLQDLQGLRCKSSREQ